MKVKTQSPSFFIFIGIIFGVLFGFISFGVYTENDLVNYLDLTIIEMIQSNVTESKTYFLATLSEIGNIRLIIALTIGLVLFLFSKRWFVAGIWFGGTILCCAAVGTKLIKMAVDRTRPDILPLIEKTTESFPSGHATSSTIFYGTIGLLLIFLIRKRWKKVVIGLSALVLIGFILMTRIYLGVHFPTDVLAGLLYGLASIFISVGIYQISLRPLQQVFMKFKLIDQSIRLFNPITGKQQS